ncbi:DMT family transporter [Sorangium sp. So ce1128]
MSSTERTRRRSLPLLLVLATLWGGSYTLIRVGVATIPPITLIAARTAIAGAILWGCALAQGLSVPRAPGLWRQFCVQAVLNSVVPFTLIAWAERRVPAGVAAILNSMSPIFAMLLTWLSARHERVTARKLSGVVCGLAGVALVVGRSALDGWGGDVLPELSILVASGCYAMAAIYGRTFRGLSPLLPAAGSMACGAAMLVPASLLLDEPWRLHVSSASLSALLALAVFSTALAYVIYFRLMQTLGSIGTTSQAFLRVPIGVGLGALFLDESLPATAWLGLVAVVAGVAMMTLPSADAEPDPQRSQRR